MTQTKPLTGKIFTSYEVFIIAILAILQFTIVLDFMILSPLGAILIPELKISTAQFGWVVSAYAFSAGISGLLAAGFADKFDRKKLLLFFYAGFIVGTLLCGVANNYEFLLGARIVTGIFGGVIGSVSFAIITDLFRMEVRGRVMGFTQMAFAATQVLGLPLGFYLASIFGWHIPFFLIVALSVLIYIAIFIKMKPVDVHLRIKLERNAFQHLIKTISNITYVKAFGATVLLATGGFMLLPFGSTFGINNLELTKGQISILYFVTGACSIIAGPFTGKLSDVIGKYKIFVIGSIIGMIMVLIYCNLGVTPLWVVIIINVILFIGIMARMIAATALMTAIPEPADRGAFMGINASIQQISGGIATMIAGIIVVQKSEHAALENYGLLGYVVVGAMLITIAMMYMIHHMVDQKTKHANN